MGLLYFRKYVIILGEIFPLTSPPTKILGDVSPASPAGLTPVASDRHLFYLYCTTLSVLAWWCNG